jgi:hypothetical protein
MSDYTQGTVTMYGKRTKIEDDALRAMNRHKGGPVMIIPSGSWRWKWERFISHPCWIVSAEALLICIVVHLFMRGWTLPDFACISLGILLPFSMSFPATRQVRSTHPAFGYFLSGLNKDLIHLSTVAALMVYYYWSPTFARTVSGAWAFEWGEEFLGEIPLWAWAVFLLVTFLVFLSLYFMPRRDISRVVLWCIPFVIVGTGLYSVEWEGVQTRMHTATRFILKSTCQDYRKCIPASNVINTPYLLFADKEVPRIDWDGSTAVTAQNGAGDKASQELAYTMSQKLMSTAVCMLGLARMLAVLYAVMVNLADHCMEKNMAIFLCMLVVNIVMWMVTICTVKGWTHLIEARERTCGIFDVKCYAFKVCSETLFLIGFQSMLLVGGTTAFWKFHRILQFVMTVIVPMLSPLKAFTTIFPHALYAFALTAEQPTSCWMLKYKGHWNLDSPPVSYTVYASMAVIVFSAHKSWWLKCSSACLVLWIMFLTCNGGKLVIYSDMLSGRSETPPNQDQPFFTYEDLQKTFKNSELHRKLEFAFEYTASMVESFAKFSEYFV